MVPSGLDDLYRDRVILDHCRNPRNFERLDDPDFCGDAVNPFCGDEIHLQVSFNCEGKVDEVGFQGEGCAINIAAGSLMSNAVLGLDRPQILDLKRYFTSVMNDDIDVEFEDSAALGELSALLSVKEFPVRIKCVLLSWSTINESI